MLTPQYVIGVSSVFPPRSLRVRWSPRGDRGRDAVRGRVETGQGSLAAAYLELDAYRAGRSPGDTAGAGEDDLRLLGRLRSMSISESPTPMVKL